MDAQQTVLQRDDDIWVSTVQDGFYLSYISGPRACDLGDLMADIDAVCFWQFCRTLVLTPGPHVVERSLLKTKLQPTCHSNANKCIPRLPWLMIAKDEREDFFVCQRILDAVHHGDAFKFCYPPGPKASNDRAIRCDDDRLGDRESFQFCRVT